MYGKYKRAEAGIGTLILFIALILVAAVAAGVLIQTSSSLQSKALSTGSKAQTQVSTQVEIKRMWGESGTDGTLERVFVELKLSAGSDPINLNETLVDMTLSDAAGSYSNNGTIPTCNATIVSALTGGKFATEYLIKSANNRNDYLLIGDSVRICFATPRTILGNQEFTLQIIPKTGSLSRAEGTTPDVITTFAVELFP